MARCRLHGRTNCTLCSRTPSSSNPFPLTDTYPPGIIPGSFIDNSTAPPQDSSSYDSPGGDFSPGSDSSVGGGDFGS